MKKSLVREILKEALSDRGIVCFMAVDQPLVSTLTAIIGAMHLKLREEKGMTEEQIATYVAEEVGQ